MKCIFIHIVHFSVSIVYYYYYHAGCHTHTLASVIPAWASVAYSFLLTFINRSATSLLNAHFCCCCCLFSLCFGQCEFQHATKKLVINAKAKDKVNAYLVAVIGHIKITYNYVFPIKSARMTKYINKCKTQHSFYCRCCSNSCCNCCCCYCCWRLIDSCNLNLLGAVVIDILLLPPAIRPHIDSRTERHTLTLTHGHTLT